MISHRRGLGAPLAVGLGGLAVLPFAGMEVGPHPGFLPAFFAVLVLCELTTAVVLLAHYGSSPRPILLGVAVTFACSALIAVPHALVYPGVVAAHGLLPDLPGLAPWFWSAWHLVFPVGLLVSVALPIEERARPIAPGVVAALVVTMVGAMTSALVLLEPVLPQTVAGGDYGAFTANRPGLVALGAGALAAGVAAGRRRRLGRLGDWVLLTATASLVDTLLTVVAEERWTVGWYAGRVGALAAAAVVLVAILRQSVRLAGALARSNRELRAAREEAERQAAESAAGAERLSVLLEGMGDGFAALERDGTIAFLNAHGAALLGDSAGALVGRRLADVLPDGFGGGFSERLEPLRHGARAVAFDVTHPRTGRWLAVRAWAARGRISMSLRDVSERRQVEEQFAYQALHDSLTGLANRTLLLDRLRQVAARRTEGTSRFAAIFFLDLDRFKPINDTLGHEAGDVVLKEVARRLSSLVRPADTVARLGGDEFVLLCEELADRDAALGVAERVRTAIERPISVQGREVTVSVSVGIAYAEPGEDDPAALLRDADAAMYEAKARRRETLPRFEPRPRQATGTASGG